MQAEQCARALGIEVDLVEIRQARGYRARFRGAQGSRAMRFMSLPTRFVNTNRIRINTFALGRATADDARVPRVCRKRQV